MKTTLYILTLFMLFQTGFGSDEEFGDDNTQYDKDIGVNVLALSYSQSNFNHSIGIGIKAINQHSTIRNFQITPLSFDIQTNDIYNEKKNSYSYLLSTINLAYIGLGVLTEDYIKKK